jgi:hypothetical protein
MHHLITHDSALNVWRKSSQDFMPAVVVADNQHHLHWWLRYFVFGYWREHYNSFALYFLAL